jgi:hypothetical protein
MSRRIATVSELIEHFGGLTPLARLVGTSPQMVVHWRRKNYIPAHHYKRHMRVLKQSDPFLHISEDLYGWAEAPEAAE